MKKQEVKLHIENYLKSHFLKYKSHFLKYSEDVDDGIDGIAILFKNCEHCTNNYMEGCIYFYDEEMEVRVYYNELDAKLCAKSSHKSELFELFNYINAKIWPRGTNEFAGGLYEASYLYAPRIYMTEDGCHDITMTDIIPYDFFEVAPLETEDFFTASLPYLMNKLRPAIFCLLIGEMSLGEAKQLIDHDVLEEES